MAKFTRSNALIAILCVFLIARAQVNAAAVPAGPLLQPQTRDVNDEELCGFVGNTDAYGFGIRLGIYLQWTAVILSCRFIASPAARKELMDAHTLFSSAILIATIVLSVQDTGLHSIEIVILLFIWYTDGWNSMAMYINNDQMENTFYGGLYRIMLACAMGGYGLWFWFRGVYTFQRTPCGTFTFLFAKVDIYGRSGTFFRAIFCINIPFLVLYMLVIGASSIPTVATVLKIFYNVETRNYKQRKGLADLDINLNHGPSHFRGMVNGIFSMYFEPMRKTLENDTSTRPEEKYEPALRFIFRYTPIISLIWSVLAIELMIHWNHITGVYTLGQTGQLIPLVIGIGGLVKTLYSISNELWQTSVWYPEFEAFRKPGGPWMRFEKKTPKHRNSI